MDACAWSLTWFDLSLRETHRTPSLFFVFFRAFDPQIRTAMGRLIWVNYGKLDGYWHSTSFKAGIVIGWSFPLFLVFFLSFFISSSFLLSALAVATAVRG
ncbi:hypothetical protein P168DRAFT_10993 [Aspergillus campestris IBT 28561]|uniref:Uncharacterized protein n=1 Tax=Aspergillus campestris (strain IBT 28561) TaxID=1392248 RepID=A0A2I1DEB4_ASPC2|nr:uncharacterized protein P168DRAFT_10993 [Aspergillus campestris IBT 28561]PKY08190.1 hypothetical protein P168DRAFT_10993 [Aspergillus campestris IBT 28561]